MSNKEELTSSYLGNPLLKPAGIPHNFTQEELDEYLKCSSDPEYFIENHIKLIITNIKNNIQ